MISSNLTGMGGSFNGNYSAIIRQMGRSTCTRLWTIEYTCHPQLLCDVVVVGEELLTTTIVESSIDFLLPGLHNLF